MSHQANKPRWNDLEKWMTLSSAAHLICGVNRKTTIVTTPRPATSSSSSIAAPMCASPCLLPAGCWGSVGRQISWCQSRKWVHGVVRKRRRRTRRERNHGIVVFNPVYCNVAVSASASWIYTQTEIFTDKRYACENFNYSMAVRIYFALLDLNAAVNIWHNLNGNIWVNKTVTNR